jgi:glucans biosynthesis protein
MNEFRGNYTQHIRFTTDFFNLNAIKGVANAMPPDAGYAGFRLLYKINKPNKFDEFIAFLGKSYFRALGRNNTYGLSSRAVTINTLVSGKKEEFPTFTEFWLGKPDKKDNHVVVYALLNGKSVTGAYQFDIYPGDITTVKVRSTLYLRKKVDVLGLCPVTSFFWFGENSTNHFGDYRPEVHDSDGLIISAEKVVPENVNAPKKPISGSKQNTSLSTKKKNRLEKICIWQPLVNYVNKSATISNYHFDKINYFGLLQRDRNYKHYLDPNKAYDKEPNLWITPGKNWGTGTIRLLELPTNNEKMDNIALFWIPDIAPDVGKAFNFDYTMHWSMKSPPIDTAMVKFTRTGINHSNPEQHIFIVEFTGEKLSKLASVEPVTAKVKISENGKLIGQPEVIKDTSYGGTWRLKFAVEQAKNPEKAPINLSATLFYKNKKVSETWKYIWRP